MDLVIKSNKRNTKHNTKHHKKHNDEDYNKYNKNVVYFQLKPSHQQQLYNQYYKQFNGQYYQPNGQYYHQPNGQCYQPNGQCYRPNVQQNKIEYLKPIFLSLKEWSQPINDKFRSSNHEIMKNNRENCNDHIFNKSKYVGLICKAICENKNIAIPSAGNFVDDKGIFTLERDMLSKLKATGRFNFILVTDLSNHNPNLCPKKQAVINCINNSINAQIISFKQFKQWNITNLQNCSNGPRFSLENVRFTCGFNIRYHHNSAKDDNSQVMIGHITRGFDISLPEAIECENSNKDKLLSSYNGTIIGIMMLNEKSNEKTYGGFVIHAPELGDTAHITVNTTLRNVLSENIVENYVNNKIVFELKSIDPNAKHNPTISIKKIGDKKFHVIDWYTYVV